MTDRPIIFSGPMIRALLDGRKTQTRRVLKPQPEPGSYRLSMYDPRDRAAFGHDAYTRKWSVKKPYAPGDRLWVREALDLGDRAYSIGHATYAADGADVDLRPAGAAAWAGDYKRRAVPSIHMPRWASRLTLHVTKVRVQRLQEISEADAVAEGFPPANPLPCGGLSHTAGDMFCELWESLHGEGSWDANPWVAAISFEVKRANIDNARDAA